MSRTLKKIAVLNFGGLGDNILFLPVINTLCELLPETEITWITETRSRGIHDLLPEQVHVEFIATQGVSRIALFKQLRKLLTHQKYDAVIASGSSPFISVLLASTGIPIRVGYNTGLISTLLLSQAAPLYLDKYAAEMHYELIKAFTSALKKPLPVQNIVPSVSETVVKKLPASGLPSESYIAIHPGVSLASIQKNILKGWPAERWCELTQLLLEKYPSHKILLLGGPDDNEIIAAIQQQLSPTDLKRITNYAGKTDTVAKLATVLRQVKVLVCVDSAPMHLAVALATPIVALFSPTDPFKLLPYDIAELTVRRTDLPCQPCLFDVRKTSCEAPVCLNIPADWVFKKITAVVHYSSPKNL